MSFGDDIFMFWLLPDNVTSSICTRPKTTILVNPPATGPRGSLNRPLDLLGLQESLRSRGSHCAWTFSSGTRHGPNSLQRRKEINDNRFVNSPSKRSNSHPRPKSYYRNKRLKSIFLDFFSCFVFIFTVANESNERLLRCAGHLK